VVPESLFEESIRVHGTKQVVVFAYFDETEGGAGGALTAVVGYLFDAEGVSKFRDLYRRDLEPHIPPQKDGRRIFHAADIYAGNPPFSGRQKDFNEFRLAKMAEIIGQSVSMGVIMGIGSADYQLGLQGRFIPATIGGKRVKSLAPWVGSPYSVCLFRCVQKINEWLDEQNIPDAVEYVMESGRPKLEKEALAIFSRIAAHPHFSKDYRIGKYGFTPKGPSTPWLFAPDHYAWEWQRWDRLAESPDDGEWRQVFLKPIEARPHYATYLSEKSVNLTAMVNAVNKLMIADRDDIEYL